MQNTSTAVTKSVNKEKTHAIRNCIVCGKDEAKPLFSFTADFLSNVRKQKLDEIKWQENTTSTIVQCASCRCNYIRDVFIADEDKFDTVISAQAMENHVARYSGIFTFDSVDHMNYSRAVIEVLLKHCAAQGKKRISLLDFGSSLSMLSMFARCGGFDTVVSYDPKFPLNISDLLSTKHPLTVHFARSREELLAFAPFDAIVCQSAIEHFYDPQAELRLMHELLDEKGMLFINNPLMPLDKELKFLKNESGIKDKRLLKILRKSYHIDHLNYLTEKHFSALIRKSGFREKKTFFFYRLFKPAAFLQGNVVRFIKACVIFMLDLAGVKYKKVNFFLVK
ncbi:MAG TPA: methyltransferase domain-containing protein [Candidatus Omnitrophota bacterium]|nr:methyltransferase domain-containing protein [Candidatus Omnitrophota bacterium]HRZ15302.1 methyltransferase domain-containing protein [Candidatus Omnitrophota bacterium]